MFALTESNDRRQHSTQSGGGGAVVIVHAVDCGADWSLLQEAAAARAFPETLFRVLGLHFAGWSIIQHVEGDQGCPAAALQRPELRCSGDGPCG
jgi:hypothetical protein